MDVAALSLQIDSSSVVKATAELDKFTAAAKRASGAGGGGASSGNTAKMAQDYARAADKAAQYSGAAMRAAAANDNMALSAGKMASANDNAGRALAAADAHVIAYTQHLAGLVRAQQDANAHVVAWQNRLQAVAPVLGQADAHVVAYRNSLNKVGESAKAAGAAIQFTARDGLNASRQLADIGVTAAMGMSPFMIALQQGPQLFDILQEKAIAAGTSIGTAFKAAGAAIWTAMLPLLPIIAAVAAVLAVVTGALAALTAQANNDSGLKKYTTSMGYTKEEVKKLNAVTVTFGDTATAVFQVAFERIAKAVGLSTAGIKKAWKSMLDFLITAVREVIAAIYASFTAMGYAIARVITNIKAGKFENPLTTLVESYKSARADAMGFMDDVVAQARKNAGGRQDEMAAGFHDKPSGGAGADKANRLADILRDAQAAITAEQNRLAMVGMSARAAAELEQKAKLLNDVAKAGIPITKGLSAEIDRLSKAYADAKIAADTAVAIQSVSDSITAQIDAVADDVALIGLYGDALIRARNEVEALAKANASLPKGEIISIGDATRIADEAGRLSRDQIQQGQLKRAEDLRKSSEDMAFAMDLEAKGLGLAGEAAIAYAFAAERLNQAQRDGTTLTPEYVASINAAGAAYAKQRYAIDKQRQAIADTREVVKGFFTDWFGKVRDGANVFKSFADSVISSLNRIIDKLLDKTLNNFLDKALAGGGSGSGPLSFLTNLFGGGGGSGAAAAASSGMNFAGGMSAFGFANGGAFDRAQRFANGGAFTNSIVNQSTLFRFANGAALGEMGEKGPEAIMPLSRDSSGRLGVQAHGGGGQRKIEVNIHNHNSFAGALGADSIVALNAQAAEVTENQIWRGLQSRLEQLDADGSFAS